MKGIKSSILSRKGKKPKRNIQLEARKIRYALISNYCLKNNTNYLVTAHHQDDQIENFFIRLFRGSGLTGLSSMAEYSNYSENLKIIRPFLSISKHELKNVTKFYFKNYIKDPSNEDEKFFTTIVGPSIQFLQYFIHPDGSVGGEYGSRNCPLYLLHLLQNALTILC